MAEKKIYKVVITGGPCAGKTTAMSWLRNALTKKGYTVLFCPETATELISGGVAPWTCNTNMEYQRCQLQLQYAKEQIFLEAANHMPPEKIVIFFDRGFLDNKVYMTDEEFRILLEDMGFNEKDTRDWYDAVFHLVTAAKGEEKYYTLANNGARTETVEQARELDDKLIRAWDGHPYHVIIDNADDFECKMVRLLKAMFAFLGEPEPHDTVKKFLIHYPNTGILESLPNCNKEEITQTYLDAGPDKMVRIRRSGLDGNDLYYKTARYNLPDLKGIKIEESLSKEQYRRLLLDADPKYHTINKTRYNISEKNEFIKVDLYSFWDDQAIAEVELSSEADELKLPDYLEVIREVTDDEEYKVHALARK